MCVYLCTCLFASQLNALSSCVLEVDWGLKLSSSLEIHSLDTVLGFDTIGGYVFNLIYIMYFHFCQTHFHFIIIFAVS